MPENNPLFGKPNVKATNKFNAIVEAVGKRMAGKLTFKAAKFPLNDQMKPNPQARVVGNKIMTKMTPDTFFKDGISEQFQSRMTPEAFFKNESRSPQGRKALAPLIRRMLKGQEIDAPSLDVDVGPTQFTDAKGRTFNPRIGTSSHEGRHRMAVAKKLGIPDVPTRVEFFNTQGGRQPIGPGDRVRKNMTMANMKKMLDRLGNDLPPGAVKAGKKLKFGMIRKLFEKAGKGIALGIPIVGALATASDANDVVQELHKLRTDAEFRKERDEAMGRLREKPTTGSKVTGADPRGPGFRSRF